MSYLTRLLYCSDARGAQSSELVEEIAEAAARRNRQFNITGILFAADGCYLQYLEGDRRLISDLFRRISNDTRHERVMLYCVEAIVRRRFGQWGMALLQLDQADPKLAALVRAYASGDRFTPHEFSAEQAVALCEELEQHRPREIISRAELKAVSG